MKKDIKHFEEDLYHLKGLDPTEKGRIISRVYADMEDDLSEEAQSKIIENATNEEYGI